MYKQDLALNNPQGLICHKTQPNQIIVTWGMELPEFKLWLDLLAIILF